MLCKESDAYQVKARTNSLYEALELSCGNSSETEARRRRRRYPDASSTHRALNTSLYNPQDSAEARALSANMTPE